MKRFILYYAISVFYTGGILIQTEKKESFFEGLSVCVFGPIIMPVHIGIAVESYVNYMKQSGHIMNQDK